MRYYQDTSALSNPVYLLLGSFKAVILATVIISCLASLLSILFDPVLSEDSILYLRAADQFLETGLNDAVAIYPWPWLSVMIALIHSATGISAELVAHLLSACFYMILSAAFVAIVKELGASLSVQILAALTILIFPSLNDYRDNILRDHGYWACYMLSLWALIKYSEIPSWGSALIWFVATAVSFFFRVEAILFAVIGPLALLGTNQLWKYRLIMAGKLYLLILFGALVALGTSYLWTQDLTNNLRLSSDYNQASTLVSQVQKNFNALSDKLSQYVGNKYFEKSATIFLILGFAGILMQGLLSTLTPIYSAFAVLNVKRSIRPDWEAGKQIVKLFALTNLALLLCFVFYRFFLVDRYVIPLCLILLLWVPFTVHKLWKASLRDNSRVTWQMGLLVVVLGYQLLDSVMSTGVSKAYILDASEWAEQHIPKTETALSNHAHIAYFGLNGSAHTNTGRRLNGEWEEIKIPSTTRFLVLNVKQKDGRLASVIEGLSEEFKSIKTFSNERRDQVIVLERQGL